jgi:hypothetical protein
MGRASRIELSVAPNYVNWGVWQALREFFQNGQDAADEGYPMKVEYFPRTRRLTITNEGALLERSTLVLGGTTKSNTSARGQFGEGYKLACATLLRLNHPVTIDNQAERWVPGLEWSDTYGCRVLIMNVSRLQSRGSLKVQVENVTQEEWELASERLLFLTPPIITSKTSYGDALLDPTHQGNLYVGGIYVCPLEGGKYKFGYDLNTNVRLDRDRGLANPWELKNHICDVLRECVENNLLPISSFYNILNDPYCGEARAFETAGGYSDSEDFHQAIFAHFVEENGEDAIPVSSMGESIEAQHYGFRGVELNRALREVIGKVQTPFERMRSDQATDAKVTYNWSDLTREEQETLSWAIDSIAEHDDRMSLDNFSVVDFKGLNIQGSFSPDTGRVSICRSIIAKPLDLVTTIVHEVCHHDGGDGTVEHRDSCDRLLGKMFMAGNPPPKF